MAAGAEEGVVQGETSRYLFWVPDYPEQGGGRGSDRSLDSGLNSLDCGGDARCVLGVGGSEPEMCDERSQMWDVQQEGTHRESMQVRGKSPRDPAFRGSLVSLSTPLL